MKKALVKVLTPEQAELAKKRVELKKLSDRLIDQELRLAELKLSLTKFERKYYSIVGRKYVELDEIRAQIAELLAKQQPNDPSLDDEATRARAQAKEACEEYESVDTHVQDELIEPTLLEAAKKLYRNIASIIHPDKSTDEQSREVRTRLMARLNESYEKNDITEMQNILERWNECPESIAGEGTASELVRIIREIAQVKRRIAEIKAGISELMESDLYALMTKVNQAEANGRDILSEMSLSVDSRLQDAQNELISLTR